MQTVTKTITNTKLAIATAALFAASALALLTDQVTFQVVDARLEKTSVVADGLDQQTARIVLNTNHPDDIDQINIIVNNPPGETCPSRARGHFVWQPNTGTPGWWSHPAVWWCPPGETYFGFQHVNLVKGAIGRDASGNVVITVSWTINPSSGAMANNEVRYRVGDGVHAVSTGSDADGGWKKMGTFDITMPPPAGDTSFTIGQTSVRGSVMVEWKQTAQILVALAKKSSEPPSQAQWSFYDYRTVTPGSQKVLQVENLEDGVSYDIQVNPYDDLDVNALQWKTDRPFQTVIPKARDMTTEPLLFVIPKTITSVDYKQRIQDYVDGLNTVYSTTNKRFLLDEIRVYDDSNCTGPGQGDWCNIAGSALAYKPYTFPIIFTVTNHYSMWSRPSPIDPPVFHIRMPYLDLNNPYLSIDFTVLPPKSNDWAFWARVAILAHELGHTYQTGYPELYSYVGVDFTGVPPLIFMEGKNVGIPTFLPKRFWNDPMYDTYYDSPLARFSPLSAALINRNGNGHRCQHRSEDAECFHIDITHYKQSESDLRIRVVNAVSGKPVSGARVRIYCMIDARNLHVNGGPLPQFGKDDLLQDHTTDADGYVDNPVAPTIDDPPYCYTTAVKVSADGFESAAAAVTVPELQEARIAQGAATMVKTIELTPGTPASETCFLTVVHKARLTSPTWYGLGVTASGGIRSLVITKADGSRLWNDNPDCAKQEYMGNEPNGITVLNSNDFPLTAHVTDCATGAACEARALMPQ